MAPFHQRFTGRAVAPVRERRRRRWWAETGTLYLAALGAILERLTATRALDFMPPSWRPYVVAIAGACAALAVIERIERARDYRRYIRRTQGGNDGGL